jgi:predicted dienelactone hydrolase
MTSHLASHGFVVASPDHTGDTLLEFFQTRGASNPLDNPLGALPIAMNRVADVTAIIDFMQAQSGMAGSCFTGLVDAGNVGATGHSFGGFTALAASGGVTFIGGGDMRVKAILPIAPGGTSLTMASADPLLSTGGDADTSTPYTTETKAAYDRAMGPKHLVKLLGAGHLTPSDLCTLKLEAQIDIFNFGNCGVCGIVRAGCPGGTQLMETVRPALRYFSVAFFTRYLTTGSRSDQAGMLLSPTGPGPAMFPDAWMPVEAQ